MEENAILSNIATIITKDILIDESNNLRKPKHFLNAYASANGDSDGSGVRFPLLEDDDEAFEFFLRQQLHGNHGKAASDNKTKCKPSKPSTPTQPVYKGLLKQCSPTKDDTKINIAELLKGRPVTIKGFKCTELNLLNELEWVDFEGYLHMSKITFLRIFQCMRHLLLPAAFPAAVPPQTVFSLALWKLTTDEHFEEMTRKFKITIGDCQHIVRQFWNLTSTNYDAFIKWPNTPEEQLTTINGFQSTQKLKTLVNLFGIVAIKRLDIFFESQDDEVSVVLQIICNADQKIIDCFVGLAHNYNFDDSPIGQTFAVNTRTLPPGTYLVGDKSFPLKPYLMRPFEVPNQRSESIFNNMLEPALLMAQQVLDAMAKRFNILYALEAKDFNEVRKIVETVCSLHNLCIDTEDDYVERKREVIKFNWANATGFENVKGSEQNPEGVKRRLELINSITERAQE